MGLTSSLFSGLSGMNASSQALTVAGNNISNVNTAAFKRSRITFETQIARTLKNASAPSAESGGTNAAQIGLGVRLGAIRKDFSDGPLNVTGVATDMAVEGAGFFIVNVNGAERFTRDGGFVLDRDANLVMPNTGGRVQGFGIDENFNVVEGLLQDINIPLGALSIAEATSEVSFIGNLDAGGDIATQGTIIQSDALFSDAGLTTAADGSTALTSLHTIAGGATPVYSTGDVITFSGASRGGKSIGSLTFEVGAANTTGSDAFGTTVQELLDFMDAALGIDAGTSGGVSIAGGVINIEGNAGLSNRLQVQGENLTTNVGSANDIPIQFDRIQEADGESVQTSVTVFDSLGNPVNLDLTLVLEATPNSGTVWRYFAHSADDTDLDRFLDTGTLSFNPSGKLVSVSDSTVTIDREQTGALSPLTFELSFNDGGKELSAFNQKSEVNASSQNGFEFGTLEDFNVEADGLIRGVFTNGEIRPLGRIPLATFANAEGLTEEGSNLLRQSVNSGLAVIVTPQSGGSGSVVGRSVELSNVELADEFVSMINASTGFSASSRVITTSNDLIDELLNVVR